MSCDTFTDPHSFPKCYLVTLSRIPPYYLNDPWGQIFNFQNVEDVLFWDEVEGIFKKNLDDDEEAEIIVDKNYEWEQQNTFTSL